MSLNKIGNSKTYPKIPEQDKTRVENFFKEITNFPLNKGNKKDHTFRTYNSDKYDYNDNRWVKSGFQDILPLSDGSMIVRDIAPIHHFDLRFIKRDITLVDIDNYIKQFLDWKKYYPDTGNGLYLY